MTHSPLVKQSLFILLQRSARLGLGFVITRAIALAYCDGRVVTSEESAGTCFTMTLPLLLVKANV